MGNLLTHFVVPDTSKDVVAPEDRKNGIWLAIFWIASLQGCAMVFTTCALVDRWMGPYDRKRVGFGSVLAAMLLSTAWPVVLLYLNLFSG